MQFLLLLSVLPFIAAQGIGEGYNPVLERRAALARAVDDEARLYARSLFADDDDDFEAVLSRRDRGWCYRDPSNKSGMGKCISNTTGKKIGVCSKPGSPC